MEEGERKIRKRTLNVEAMIKLYKEGSSTTEIGKLANVSARYVRMVLNKHNIERRPRGSWKRKYQVNENYFKTWSNNMAYILGFFVADGMVAREAQMVNFAQKDAYILEAIKKEMESEHPLYQNKKTGVYILSLNSKIMKEDLVNIHGLMPNKSNQVLFPKVPEEYMSHFIRGYFDGDGYINYDKYTVTFVGGSIVFMQEFVSLLIALGFNPQLRENNNHIRVHIRGRRSIAEFANWIYKDKDLFLKRKHAVFNEEKLKLSILSDRKDKCTVEAVKMRKLTFLAIYSTNKSIECTCEMIGIKYGTYKRWIKSDNHFNMNYNRVKDLMNLK